MLKSKLPGRFSEIKKKVTFHSYWQAQIAGMKIVSAKEHARHSLVS